MFLPWKKLGPTAARCRHGKFLGTGFRAKASCQQQLQGSCSSKEDQRRVLIPSNSRCKVCEDYQTRAFWLQTHRILILHGGYGAWMYLVTWCVGRWPLWKYEAGKKQQKTELSWGKLTQPQTKTPNPMIFLHLKFSSSNSSSTNGNLVVWRPVVWDSRGCPEVTIPFVYWDPTNLP